MGDTFGGRVGVPITSVLIAVLAPRRVLFLLFLLLAFYLASGHAAAAVVPLHPRPGG